MYPLCEKERQKHWKVSNAVPVPIPCQANTLLVTKVSSLTVIIKGFPLCVVPLVQTTPFHFLNPDVSSNRVNDKVQLSIEHRHLAGVKLHVRLALTRYEAMAQSV